MDSCGRRTEVLCQITSQLFIRIISLPPEDVVTFIMWVFYVHTYMGILQNRDFPLSVHMEMLKIRSSDVKTVAEPDRSVSQLEA